MLPMMQQVTVPEGQRGPWKIQRFTVAEDAVRLNNLRTALPQPTLTERVPA